jgi:hypothetical protein
LLRPETAYARSGDVHIAYQVFGEGNLDLVLVNGFTSHLEREPGDAHVARRDVPRHRRARGSGIQFSDRGKHALKGIPDTWQLLAVTSPG